MQQLADFLTVIISLIWIWEFLFKKKSIDISFDIISYSISLHFLYHIEEQLTCNQ